MEIASCLESLIQRQQPNGSFLPREGGEARPDATAWGALGLRAAGEETKNLVERARQRLLLEQMPDGRVSISMLHPSVCWPTTIALLAWNGWAAGEEGAKRGLEYLTKLPVATIKANDRVNAMDSSLHGWTWIAGTTCWVEPTALTVFAFDRYAKKTDRVQEGIKLLLDRQLSHGGWNYGNTIVYDTELLPAEEYVGVALTGLAGHCEEAEIARSIDFIEKRLPKLRSPLALSWGILGLAAWGRRPADADQWISECLDRQKVVGPFVTTHLALLLIASHCQKGLISLFPA